MQFIQRIFVKKMNLSGQVFFFWLKLPYLDNRFHKVAKIWEDS
jgi:hypothetical protein